MNVNTLATELQVMAPVASEAEGISNFANAWANYFMEATVLGTKILSVTLLESAKSAMKSAMTGVSSSGFASITAGITAFWGVVATSAAVIWVMAPPLASATPPPGLASLTTSMQAKGDENITNEASLVEAMDNLAQGIHPLNLGGIAVNTAVPPVGIPIL